MSRFNVEIQYQAFKGTNIWDVSKEMVWISNHILRVVNLVFNGVMIAAHPGDDYKDVLAEYNKQRELFLEAMDEEEK